MVLVFNFIALIKIVEGENLICTINGCFFKSHNSEMSYYSQILDFLLKARKDYKNKMFEAKQAKDTVKLQLYDMKQQVYKIIANSLYGILGNNAFRFFDIDCARTITLSGQESIKTCIVEANNYVESLKTKEYIKPEVLTKEEVFTEKMYRETKNVITGDTDSIFLTYSKLIERGTSEEDAVKKVLEWNDNVHVFLNNTIIPEIITRHNITKKVNRLELKNELVIKRGLFLAKKRYALHVIFQEGRKTDEIKPMGLEVRRSDFPSLTKQKLNELLELILKSKEISLKNIYEYIEENKKLLVDEIAKGSKTIARPVSFTQKVEEYKLIPQGVKGMVNFNTLEYHAFDVGSRGYLFKLKGIDLEKAPESVQKNYDKYFTAKGKSIAEIVIPETELRLPPYYIMDKKAILEFAWIDRYSQLLEPLLPREEVLKW